MNPPPARFVPTERARLVFFVTVAFWLVVPVALRGSLAQDALPYVVAGDMVGSHPDDIYAAEDGDLFTVRAPFGDRFCELAPPGTECSEVTVAFVSTPPAIPLAMAVSAMGADAGTLVMRLLGTGCLSAGMVLLWRRLAHRTPAAGSLLAATAVLLTPFVLVPASLGQTSQVLFLSACLGVTATSRGPARTAWTAAVWVVAVALKAFPGVQVLLLAWQRRWGLIAWSIGLGAFLSVLALVLAPAGAWPRFVEMTGELAQHTDWNPYNGSIDALVHNVAAPVTDRAVGRAVLMAVRLGGAGALLWWVVRRADDDTQWAVSGLALLLVAPLVWWHYLWVAIGAVGVTLAGRRRLDDRTMWVLPILAAITIPISLPNGRGWSIPVAQGLFLIAAAVVVAVLVGRDDAGASAPETLPAGARPARP